MAHRTMDRPTFGGSLRLGASFPNHVSSLPAPSSLNRKLFAIFSPYGPIYFVARTPNLLDVHKPYAVVGGSGGSSYLNPSEPNSQKANGRKDRNGAFVA